MALFQLDHIVHAYGDRPVLTIDHWQVPTGAILGLYGPNGSGKSTLLRLLGCVERPASGTIAYQGRPAEPFADSVRGKVVLLPQTSFLLRRTVFSNVAYGLRIGGVGDAPRRIAQALRLVGLDPAVFAQRPWFALSGGEARRVALAARLALRPRVLLLDEPTASVDTLSAQMIQAAALHAHHEWGTSLIITSHDHQWLHDTCTDTVYLFRGKLLGNGRMTLLFGPWHPGADGLVYSPLAADRLFFAGRPPSDMETAVAAIDARHMALHHALPPSRRPDQIVLQGTVVALGTEKDTQSITVSLSVGRTIFNGRVVRQDLVGGRFIPGSAAWMVYTPDKVAWV